MVHMHRLAFASEGGRQGRGWRSRRRHEPSVSRFEARDGWWEAGGGTGVVVVRWWSVARCRGWWEGARTLRLAFGSEGEQWL